MPLSKVDEQVIFRATTALKAAATFANATGIITSNGHGLVVGDNVRFSNSGGALPTGISATTDYYVISVTTNTFLVSATVGGASITFSDDGSGTNSFTVIGKTILTDGYQHVKLTVVSANTSTWTIKIQGSNSFDKPNFASAASTTNQWFYKQLKDEQDASTVNGSTGIATTGTDITREFEINVNVARWICANVTAFTQGTVEMRVSLFNNSAL